MLWRSVREGLQVVPAESIANRWAELTSSTSPLRLSSCATGTHENSRYEARDEDLVAQLAIRKEIALEIQSFGSDRKHDGVE
jgi:hypothetical protein